MLKCLLFAIALFFVGVNAFCQSTDSVIRPGMRFHSINQIGLIKGQQKDLRVQLQTINGIEFKKVFLGLGAGIDYYDRRSIPLFADLRTSLPFSNHSFFTYGDIGVNFPWEKDVKKEWIIYKNKAGLYYDLGLGYSIKTTKRNAFFISAGYSRKERKEKTTNYWMNGGQIVYGQSYNYSYQQRRIVVKLGLMF